MMSPLAQLVTVDLYCIESADVEQAYSVSYVQSIILINFMWPELP